MTDLPLERFNSLGGWLDESTDLGGDRVKLRVHHAGEDAVTARARAIQLLHKIAADREAIFAYCAGELLQTKNTDWSDEEHPPVDAHEFTSRLRLRDVVFRADRTVTLGIDAGDLFWGHWIVAHLDESGEPTMAYLEG